MPAHATGHRNRPRSDRSAAWWAVVGFGLVSLTADMVYEGARSISGPLLASLGASALVVGAVTGAGEGAALVLRLVFGAWADRRRSYWRLTFVGYLLTAVCVPALALTPFLAGFGLLVASALILAERTGKAVRSPAKSALLAQVAGKVGLGRGFAVHKALDQVGAVAGPLLVAGVVALTGAFWPALAVLAVPGAIAMVILHRLRRLVGDRVEDGRALPVEVADRTGETSGARRFRRRLAEHLPRTFWLFATAAGATTFGLVTFGVISFHLVQDGVVSAPGVPLVYAAGMGAAAVAALLTGDLYDRYGGRVLYGLPFLVAVVPPLVFDDQPVLAVVGVIVWGAATGLQDSTVKALVADLVPSGVRATAYGAFATVQGGAAVAGGVFAGGLYEESLPALLIAIALIQVVALVLLVITVRSSTAVRR
jgi:MFS family permease